jgi:hypothetical protein
MGPASGGATYQTVSRPVGGHNAAGGYVSAGWRVYPTANADAYPMLGVFDGSGNRIIACIVAAPNGVIKAWSGVPTTVGAVFLGASDPGGFDYGVDFDIEVFVKVNGSSGEIEVRIDTISVLHLINVNTDPYGLGYFDSICWGTIFSGAATANYSVDDFRYYDTAGARNNSFLGTCQVQTSFPASNGSTTNFASSNTGLANWQNIDNRNIDDSLYLYDPSVGDVNLNGITPLFNAPTVFWVDVTVVARQDQATQMYVETQINSGGVSASGARFPTTQTYSGDSDVFELNPATGLSFTGAQVNALQIGLKIVP